MNAEKAMEADRFYGRVKVTAKHRETAWKILHDKDGLMLMDAIVTEVVATLLAKAYSEDEL